MTDQENSDTKTNVLMQSIVKHLLYLLCTGLGTICNQLYWINAHREAAVHRGALPSAPGWSSKDGPHLRPEDLQCGHLWGDPPQTHRGYKVRRLSAPSLASFYKNGKNRVFLRGWVLNWSTFFFFRLLVSAAVKKSSFFGLSYCCPGTVWFPPHELFKFKLGVVIEPLRNVSAYVGNAVNVLELWNQGCHVDKYR